MAICKQRTIAAVMGGLIAVFAGAARAETPSGWDYNLTKKCAKTPYIDQQNYYQETAECSTAKHWSLVVQAESTLGQSCIGPNAQSYLINGAGSPVTLGWIPHNSDLGSNWTANVKVDTSAGTACPNQNTFFGFFDDIEHGGGPLPNLSNLQSSHELSYAQFALDGGEVRLTLGAQIFWGGKAHILEILPARIGYNTNPGLPPGVIAKTVTDTIEYVIIDNSWGISVNPNGTTHFLYVDWASLFSTMINLGLFTSPGAGATGTQGVYVAVETHNKAIGNLYHTNFRVSSKTP